METKPNKNKPALTRRDFLRSSALLTAGAAVTGPIIVPSSVFGKNAPSNRITIGCIGTGIHGTTNIKKFAAAGGAQVVAVCDVDADHLEDGRSLAELDNASAYNDFRDLLARADIDAVVITTPGHWHVPMSTAAIRAKKDVYCEKPLTRTIAEGRILSDMVKKYGTVFQTGSHQRSDSQFRLACELVRNGRIGKLHTIKVEIPKNSRPNPFTWQPEPIPQALDYDLWLGPAPWAPYTPARCHYSFRFMYDYSGGQLTNWGAHYLDIAQWANNTDHTGPVQIDGRGADFPKQGLFNTATKVNIEYTYADGVKMFCKTKTGSQWDGNVTFEGTEGRLFVDRNNLKTEPTSLLDSHIGPDEIHLYNSPNHAQNFIDCIKLRKDPVATVEIGHRTASICHLGNIAMRLGRKLNWNPKTERFINDPPANRLLEIPMRTPWRL